MSTTCKRIACARLGFIIRTFAGSNATEEDVLLVAPGRVPFSVVVALTRVEVSSRLRDWDGCRVVALVTWGRVAWLCFNVRDAAEVGGLEPDMSGFG